MKDLTLNGTTLSSSVTGIYVNKVVRSLLGGVRDVYKEFPGLSGSWRFVEKPGDRHLVASLTILSNSYALRRTAVKALASWADVGVASKLIVSDESDRYWDAKLITPPDPDEWVNHAVIDLEFRVGPYSKATSTSSSSVTATNNVDFTVALPDAVEAYPIIEVTASADMTTGFTITCNGNVFTYATALTSGNKVTVSSLAYAVTTGANADTNCDGTFVAANLSMAGVDGVFPVLQPGNNTVRITGANSTATFLWRRRYR